MHTRVIETTATTLILPGKRLPPKTGNAAKRPPIRQRIRAKRKTSEGLGRGETKGNISF
jgi:hypothetical protein